MHVRLQSYIGLLTVSLLFSQVGLSQDVSGAPEGVSPLAAGFQHPPQSAQPRVWWHWMNGNVTRQGIRLDLDWMHRIGISGMDTIDASIATPQIVPDRAVYMDPAWKSDFLYATKLAESFGMRESIDSSPGWSETGGPWVKPSDGMKKYVWSEIVIPGGKHFNGKLPHPPTTTGAFQDEAPDPAHRSPTASKLVPTYYHDSVVIAYRLPQTDVTLESLHPRMSSSGGSPDYSLLTDGNLVNTTPLPIPQDGRPAWIQYQFSSPVTIRAITIVMQPISRSTTATYGIGEPSISLDESEDGKNWHTSSGLDISGSPETTISFSPVTSMYYRVVFQQRHTLEWAAAGRPSQKRSLQCDAATGLGCYNIAEIVLHTGARVNHFEQKAAFVPTADLYRFPTPVYSAHSVVSTRDVVDLTEKMNPNGYLDWTPPPGQWAILRFGYSLLGSTNHPAPAESTGLEVDKLSGQAVQRYMEDYLGTYTATVGSSNMSKRGITSVTTDSWEAGSQNWTEEMFQKFQKLRGYDPTPWMPVLTGVVVGSSEESDRFLWDFRRTIGDLIATEHFGVIQNVLDQEHLIHYCESDEYGRAFVADGMQVKQRCQVPMGAMWVPRPGQSQIQYDYNADDRESSSVAHIYGKKLTAAESMTTAVAPWSWSPATLRATVDQEFLNGVNRIFVHESAEQPLLGHEPGLTLGIFGQWFNRNETWANEASPWVSYLARNSYMLQQGKYVADILYYYGQDTNLTALYQHRAPNIPEGYGFDYVNADTLLHALGVNRNKQITTPGGVNYKILGLNRNSRHMSLDILEAIYNLVKQGAIVAGPKPTDDPSLTDDQASFHSLVQEMFGNGNSIQHIGTGTIYAGQTVADVLHEMAAQPDMTYTGTSDGANLQFIHRRLADGEIYFVDNRSDVEISTQASFRVTGLIPELWRADTGEHAPVSYVISGGRTSVQLNLHPWESVFVVFQGKAQTTSWLAPAVEKDTLATIDGAWEVKFPPHWGAPSSVTLKKLISWSDSGDVGVKYFSGTATYVKTIVAPPGWFHPGTKLWIDLGTVKNLAELSVNGHRLAILWHAPYETDATAALHPGINQIQIKVTNAWVNRIIGDLQPGAKEHYTYTDYKPYTANSPLLSSGLLGPVTIDAVKLGKVQGRQ